MKPPVPPQKKVPNDPKNRKKKIPKHPFKKQKIPSNGQRMMEAPSEGFSNTKSTKFQLESQISRRENIQSRNPIQSNPIQSSGHSDGRVGQTGGTGVTTLKPDVGPASTHSTGIGQPVNGTVKPDGPASFLFKTIRTSADESVRLRRHRRTWTMRHASWVIRHPSSVILSSFWAAAFVKLSLLERGLFHSD